MKNATLLISLVPPAFVANPASAAQEAKSAPRRAMIPFANSGGVWDWTAGEDDRTVYFQDRHRQWFKATLFMQAFDLPYRRPLGIEGGVTNTVDRWGAIYVGRQRYSFQSFERVGGPPARGKKARGAKPTS